MRVLGYGAGVLAAVVLVSTAAVALAQNAAPAAPSVTTGQSGPAQSPFGQAPTAAMTIKRLLEDGYEIKTGFVDPNGGAYIALQKGTAAYFCHSNPNPTCEKLN